MNDKPRSRAEAFDTLFKRDPDPWNFATSDYECQKRAATIAILPQRRYERALEIGCATGFLARELAPLCEKLLALDVSQTALNIAADRLRPYICVALAKANIPNDWPSGRFDLIVFSEVLYFLDAVEISSAARLARACLEPGGLCLLVNWTGETDLPLSGTEVTQLFMNSAGWSREREIVAEQYRIDLLS